MTCVGHSAPAWSRYACAAADHLHVGALNSKDPDRAAALTAEHFQITTLQPWRTALAAAIARSFLYQPAESSLRRVVPPAAAMCPWMIGSNHRNRYGTAVRSFVLRTICGLDS